MSSTYGTLFKISTFGESHGPAIGVVIDGCPAGLAFDTDFIQQELDRRKPGQSRITTQRREADEFEVLSGVFDGQTQGTPIALLIRNTDQRSKDYGHIARQFRPSHADYTYQTKYGSRDYRVKAYDSPRYRQLAKRLSSLIRDIVQYASDLWEAFDKSKVWKFNFFENYE